MTTRVTGRGHPTFPLVVVGLLIAVTAAPGVATQSIPAVSVGLGSSHGLVGSGFGLHDSETTVNARDYGVSHGLLPSGPPLANASSPNSSSADEQTLVLFNETLVPGNFPAINGADPYGDVYDPATGELFVADYGQNAVSVISVATREVVAGIAVGSLPYGIVYDPVKGEVFVADSGSNNVSVISDSTDRAVASIPVGSVPFGLVYDSGTGDIYVSNSGSNNVSVISDANDTIVATIPVGSEPWGLAYDSTKHEVFVANSGGNNVSVISDSTRAVVAQISVGTWPTSVVFDPAQDEEFVANLYSNNLSIVSDGTNAVLESLPDPYGAYMAAFDSGKDEVFVANDNQAGNVSVISATSNTIVSAVSVGVMPDDVTYDAADAAMFVTSWGDYTVEMISDGNNTVEATIETGSEPSSVAYDGQTNQLFVANAETGQIVVLDPTSGRVAGSVTTPGAFELAYDSGTDQIFDAPGFGYSEVYVISGSSDQVVANISIDGVPYGLGYDPAKSEVFVATNNYVSYSSSVEVISDQSDKVVATIPVPYAAVNLAYDAGTGQVFVSSLYSNSVEVISDSNNSVVAQVQVGSEPMGVAYDPSSREIFVANSDSGNVSVISDVSDTVVANIPVGSYPEAALFEPQPGLILVTNLDPDNVSLLGSSTDEVAGSIDVGQEPWGIAYDSTNGRTYVACEAGGSLSILTPFQYYPVSFVETGLPLSSSWSTRLGGLTNSSTNPSLGFEALNGTYHFSVASPSGFLPNPSNGSITVQGGPVTTSVSFTAVFAANFTESGLPLGTEWWVNLTSGQTANSTANSISFNETNGTYDYTVATTDKEYAPVSWNGSFEVNGTSVSESVTFRLVNYTVTFTETGLPSRTNWSLTLGGARANSATSLITLPEPNGTHSYTITDVPSWHQTTLPYTGNLTVSGAPVIEPTLVFTRVTYNVTFTESGLPNSTEWWVNLTNHQTSKSSTNFVSFSEPNGTYDYTIATMDKMYTSVGGSLAVKGIMVSETVSFTLVIYSVTFTETGLPIGPEWWVNVTGHVLNGSTPATIAMNLSNGTYPYTVATTDKSYRSLGGVFTVSGASVSESVTFNLVTYPITFTETGLPAGTEWWVGVNQVPPFSFNSSTTGLGFEAPNGTYSFTVGSVSGYTVNLSAGSFTVNGAPVQLPIAFTPTSGAATFLGLPAAVGYALLGAIVAVILVIVVVAVVLRRRRKNSPTAVSFPSQPDAGSPPVPP